MKAHPAEIEVLALALGRESDAPNGVREHVASCATCARRETELKSLADALRLENELAEDLEKAAPRPESTTSVGGRARLARLAEDADAALREADAFLEEARDEDVDLEARVRDMASSDAGRLTLLYALQRGSFSSAVPQRALRLCDAVRKAAAGDDSGSGGVPVPSALLRAEASSIASHALLCIGRLDEARSAAVAARAEHATLGSDPFAFAVCDYFEASVMCFQGEFAPAERLLGRCARVFAEYAQDHWVGRAETVLGTILLQNGNHARALAAFDSAIERLDPDRDSNAFVVTLISRARCLGALSRFESARQGFAQALQGARRHRLDALVFAVRQNLAELELLRGDVEKSLASYRAVALEADRLGLEEDQVVTRLAAAECLGRLGRTGEMVTALREIGRHVAVTDLRGNPAWSELAARLDPGDVDVGLVSEVRRHLEAARDGFVLPFRATRRA